MKRLKVLSIVSSLFFFAAAGAAQAQLTRIYGPAYITHSKEEHKDKGVKLTFTAPVPGPGVVVVKNGGDSGKSSRVSSAEIELNGKKVASQKDFNKNVDSLQFNVNLLADNEMEVEVESCNTCEIEVTVLGEEPVLLPTRVLPTR